MRRLAFRAMGTEVCLTTVGGSRAALRAARDRIVDLESLWSRFRPSSELSRLAASGRPARVSQETLTLVERAVWGWTITGGLFDPTVRVSASGYDRSFELIGARPRVGPSAPAPGCANVAVDRDACTVTLPPGVAIDPGGVGKGLAADLVCERLLADGAGSVCVDVGGDVRVAGSDGWTVDVVDPATGSVRASVAIRDGAAATSSVVSRSWRGGHHVVDPRTGRPSSSALATVTVVAGEAWRAEVLATAALVSGDADVVERDGGWALLVGHDGTEVRTA